MLPALPGHQAGAELSDKQWFLPKPSRAQGGLLPGTCQPKHAVEKQLIGDVVLSIFRKQDATQEQN